MRTRRATPHRAHRGAPQREFGHRCSGVGHPVVEAHRLECVDESPGAAQDITPDLGAGLDRLPGVLSEMGCTAHEGASGVGKCLAHSADHTGSNGAGSDVGGASRHLGRDMRVGGVAQAQHHLGQPHSVSHRVVEAAHESRARGAVVKCDLLDQGDVPERAVAIEWSRALLRDIALEFGHAGRLGQSHPAHMPVEMEFRVDLPHPSALAEEGARSEDREAVDDACGRRGEQRIPVRLGIEEHDAVDDHEVVGPVHGEPQRVLRAHGPLLDRHGSPPGVARRVGRAACVGLRRTTVRRLPPTGPVTGWRHDRAGVHPHGCSHAHGRLR